MATSWSNGSFHVSSQYPYETVLLCLLYVDGTYRLACIPLSLPHQSKPLILGSVYSIHSDHICSTDIPHDGELK